MDKRVTLTNPEEIVISEDIRDPDMYIDLLTSTFAKDAESAARFEAIKALDHHAKVRWLLSQANKSDARVTREWICTTILVTTVVVVVIGYEIYQGIKKAITEKQEIQKEVEKCFEQPKKP